jgi:hypothetical protein
VSTFLSDREQVAYTMNFLRPHCVPGVEKVRVGPDKDGGYVILGSADRFDALVSLGIGECVEFDLIFADLGARVVQYDHTIEGPPTSHHRFEFRRQKVGAGPGEASLAEIISRHSLRSCRSVFLKCDIEGSEWGLLADASSDDISCFEQVSIELHDFDHMTNINDRSLIFRVLEKINRTHAVIHVHVNNCGGALADIFGLPVPPVIEVTYVRRDVGPLVPSWEKFPTALDRPNCEWGEVYVGTFTYL